MAGASNSTTTTAEPDAGAAPAGPPTGTRRARHCIPTHLLTGERADVTVWPTSAGATLVVPRGGVRCSDDELRTFRDVLTALLEAKS